MGTVYRAEQTPLGRPVALKVIHRAFVSDPKVVSRFLREAKIACQLTNPHTVTIFDFGNEEGVLYLAMELLQGQSLHERLCRGPVEPVRAAEIAAQVCRSLTEAHKKGIIHRDLKPDNIFLSSADDGALLCKVLDYGLARVMSSDESPGGIQATLTQIGTIVGTPIYMSPEQARGKKLDARTDLYSMGVVLFEMLSGVAPFLDEDAVVVLGKHIRDPVPRIAETGARVAPPAALQVLVDKLLEKEPSKRPPDAAWVFQELRAYLAQVAGRSTRLPAIEETSPPVHAPDAPPPRISPPDAASGVQPRMDEAPASDADREWEVATETESRRSRAAAAVAAPPQAMALHPTLQMESPESVALSEAPTTVPVAPRRSAPAPTRPPSGPPGTAPGPSLTTTPSPVELDALAPTSLVLWRAHDPMRHPVLSAVDTRAVPPERVFAWPGAGDSTPRWGIVPYNLGDVLALRYPNGPDTPRSPAGWTVMLASDEGASASDQWHLQRAGPGATFDVDAYLAGGGYWESRDGALPAELAAAFDGARALLEGTGLTLGEVRVHDLRGFLRERFSVVESVGSNDFAELFRLSAGATRPSVHVFFVRYIGGALGVASAIAGAQGMPGTGGSGVVVAVDATPDELLPIVVLHEIGHFAGLFHTTELDGSVFEPLTDTLVCPRDRDADRDGLLVAEECAGAGADNFMFWAGSSGRTTAQQVEILRGAMYVR